jgi:hypothetical protein
MSICGAVPFNGTADQTLSVAYGSAFILVFFVSVSLLCREPAIFTHIFLFVPCSCPILPCLCSTTDQHGHTQVTLFPLGASRLVVWDYNGPQVEDDEVRAEAARHRRLLLSGRWTAAFRRGHGHADATAVAEPADAEKAPSKEKAVDAEQTAGAILPELGLVAAAPLAHRHVAFSAPPSERDAALSPDGTVVCSPGPSRRVSPTPSEAARDTAPTPAAPRPLVTRPQRALGVLSTAARGLCTPASLAILAALVIALVPVLKALFTPVPGTHITPAPDGGPPLAVLLDTASFVGAASVPLGLVCLGGALARLPRPRGRAGWAALPTGAIGALAVGKVVVMPVLGVLICEGLTRVGVIDEADKVLRFVCMCVPPPFRCSGMSSALMPSRLFACLPTATTQVFLAQVASGTGDAGALSAFLLPQYALMLPVMVGLIAYALNMLF